MSTQRSRGRPLGSCIDDSATLARVADLVLADPGLKPTTALRSFNKKPSKALTRRIQSKWKAAKDSLMKAAQARREARISAERERAHRRAGPNLPSLRAPFGELDTVRQLLDSPAYRAARELYDSPAYRRARELFDHPGMRTARENAERMSKLTTGREFTTAFEAAQRFVSSPAMQRMAEARERVDAMLGVGSLWRRS